MIAQAYCPEIKNLNQLKVYKAYKNAVIPAHKKKPQQKPKSIETAIERINLKIDDLNKNLMNYEQNVDLTLKEIPKDIRSNFNSSKNPTDTNRTGAVDKQSLHMM